MPICLLREWGQESFGHGGANVARHNPFAYRDAYRLKTLCDRTYTPEIGTAVDTALVRLNQLCASPADGQPV